MNSSILSTLRHLPKRNLLDKLSLQCTTTVTPVMSSILPAMNISKEGSHNSTTMFTGLHKFWKEENKKLLKSNILQLSLDSTTGSASNGESKTRFHSVFSLMALAAACGFSVLLLRAGKSTAMCANEAEDSHDIIERRSHSEFHSVNQ